MERTKRQVTKVSYSEVKQYLSGGGYGATLQDDRKRTIRKKASQFTLRDGVLYRKTEGFGLTRWIESQEERNRILDTCHGMNSGKHYGRDKTRRLLIASYFWDAMVDDVARFVHQCKECQETKQAVYRRGSGGKAELGSTNNNTTITNNSSSGGGSGNQMPGGVVSIINAAVPASPVALLTALPPPPPPQPQPPSQAALPAPERSPDAPPSPATPPSPPLPGAASATDALNEELARLTASEARAQRQERQHQEMGQPASSGNVSFGLDAPRPSPWNHVCLDMIGPLRRSTSGNCHIILFTDSYTNFPEALATASRTSSAIATALQELICRYSFPEAISSALDVGRVLDAVVMMNNLTRAPHAIRMRFEPRICRLPGVMNTSLATSLRQLAQSRPDWDKHIDAVLFAHRTSRNTCTGYTPFYMLYGREPRLLGGMAVPPVAVEGAQEVPQLPVVGEDYDSPANIKARMELSEQARRMHSTVTGPKGRKKGRKFAAKRLDEQVVRSAAAAGVLAAASGAPPAISLAELSALTTAAAAAAAESRADILLDRPLPPLLDLAFYHGKAQSWWYGQLDALGSQALEAIVVRYTEHFSGEAYSHVISTAAREDVQIAIESWNSVSPVLRYIHLAQVVSKEGILPITGAMAKLVTAPADRMLVIIGMVTDAILERLHAEWPDPDTWPVWPEADSSQNWLELPPKARHAIYQCWHNRSLVELQPGEWLTGRLLDRILEVFAKKFSSGSRRVLAISSTLNQKLAQCGPTGTTLTCFTKTDLRQYTELLIPLHSDHHWALLIVNFQEQTLTEYDSMGNDNTPIVIPIRQFLALKLGVDFSTWRCLRDSTTRCGLQTNTDDCGIFVAVFALHHFIARDLATFDAKDAASRMRLWLAALLAREGANLDHSNTLLE